jgi:opacity protein-like surface antigen
MLTLKHQVFSLFALMGISAVQAQESPSSLAEKPKHEKSNSDLTGFYFGGFGGWGSNSFDVVQKGIAFYLSPQGGPLVVDSDGKTNHNGYGFGGVHVGYEWLKKKPSKVSLTPAVELEGYYFAQTKKVTLVNPTERLDFHEFEDTFPTRVGIIIADFVLALTNDYLTPYISGGLGAAIVSIRGADATQTEFPEPGINHFNSNSNAFNWAFAAQAKAGVRYSFFKHMRLFAEYRFLFIAENDYTFGHTVYPGHVATSDWTVTFDGIYNNLFSMGIDFPL